MEENRNPPKKGIETAVPLNDSRHSGARGPGRKYSCHQSFVRSINSRDQEEKSGWAQSALNTLPVIPFESLWLSPLYCQLCHTYLMLECPLPPAFILGLLTFVSGLLNLPFF